MIAQKARFFIALVALIVASGGNGAFAANKTSAPSKPKQAAPGPAPKTQDLTPAYNAYVNKLRSKINEVWNFADGKNHVVIRCTLSADGVVSNFQISSSPKSDAAEQAANAAFNQCQPLDSLPGNTPSANLTLTFDSTSSQHESSSNLTTHLEPVGKSIPVPQ